MTVTLATDFAGRDEALAALGGIERVDHLRVLAREQQLSIESELLTAAEIRAAIVGVASGVMSLFQSSSGSQQQQAATAVVILVVALQVLGEAVDALGEQRDLHFRRTGVGRMGAVLGDGLALGSSCHRYAFRVPAELRDQLVAVGQLTLCISPALKAPVDSFNLSGELSGWAG